MPYRILLLFLFLSLNSFGQVLISGKLVDENGQPAPNVTVAYKKVGRTSVLPNITEEKSALNKENFSCF